VLALGVVLCLLAAAFGTPALYPPGVALALLAVAAEAWVRFAARGSRLEREPLEATVQEGETLRLTVRIRGMRWAPGAGEVAGRRGDPFTPRRWLPGGRMEFLLHAGRRGRHTAAPSQLRIRDPFALAGRTMLSPATELLVLPRVEAIARGDLERIGLLSSEIARRPRGGGAVELDGLRAYREGAPASRIHWPTVARTGVLVERMLPPESDRHPLVVLDSSEPAGVAELDGAVRAAASLTVALARAGGCSLLISGDPKVHRLGEDLAGWHGLLARMATLEAGRPPAAAAMDRSAVVIWVSASGAHHAGRAVGAHRSLFTLSPIPRAGTEVLLHVAGCSLQAVRGQAASRAA